MAGRERVGLAGSVVVLVAGIAAAPSFGADVTLSACVAVACAIGVLTWGRRDWRPLLLAGVAGAGSLSATVAVLVTGEHYRQGSGVDHGWALAEVAGLLTVVLVLARSAPPRQGVVLGGVAGVAVPLWLLRFGLDSPGVALFGGAVLWAGAVAAAAGVGFYLRSVELRRGRAVAEARRGQRLELASDLHDFVAHDVSEILAQAQAGQIVAHTDSGRAATILKTIEQAALRALSSMDRTVRMLSEETASPGGGARNPLPTIDNLPELAARFSGATVPVILDIEAGAAERLDRESGTTAYRVVVEALTNVRRHAPEATKVDVAVRAVDGRKGDVMEVVVANDNPRADGATEPAPVIARQGGLGLAGLSGRVEALGGSLTAGPIEPHGWRVAVRLPAAPLGTRP